MRDLIERGEKGAGLKCLKITVQTSMTSEQWRKIWDDVSSTWVQRGHLWGPYIPLFWRFSPLKSLPWAKVEQKSSL